MFYATYEDALGLYDTGQMLFLLMQCGPNRLGHGPLQLLLLPMQMHQVIIIRVLWPNYFGAKLKFQFQETCSMLPSCLTSDISS